MTDKNVYENIASAALASLIVSLLVAIVCLAYFICGEQRGVG